MDTSQTLVLNLLHNHSCARLFCSNSAIVYLYDTYVWLGSYGQPSFICIFPSDMTHTCDSEATVNEVICHLRVTLKLQSTTFYMHISKWYDTYVWLWSYSQPSFICIFPSDLTLMCDSEATVDQVLYAYVHVIWHLCVTLKL